VKGQFKRLILWRFVGLAVGVGVFYAVSWMPLRIELRDFLAFLLRSGGSAVMLATVDGSPVLRFPHGQIYLSPDCTYMDLVLILLPFLWRPGKALRLNLSCLVAFAVAVQLVNLARVSFCVWFMARGYPWFYIHELPDYLLYYPTVLVVFVWCLRRDWKLCRRPAPHEVLPAGMAAC